MQGEEVVGRSRWGGCGGKREWGWPGREWGGGEGNLNLNSPQRLKEAARGDGGA